MDGALRPWWGRFDVPPEHDVRWRIGPLDLRVGRRVLEWRVAWRRGPDPVDETVRIEVPTPAGPVEPDLEIHRFALQGPPQVTLLPRLADRPMVVRPELPFHLPAGAETRVFVTTPVWVEVRVGDTELVQVPTVLASDTWFGRSTTVGELCYASKTSARLVADLVPRRATRASTEVRVVNRGATTLVLERLKVPMPSLSLYGSAKDGLWTQALTVTWSGSGVTDVDLGDPGEGELLSAPRTTEPLRAIARALGAFVS